MNPNVLILSYGALTARKLAQDLIKLTGGEPVAQQTPFAGKVLETYAYKNKTKYYENNLNFIVYDDLADNIPEELWKTTEGLIVYFNPNDAKFLQLLPILCRIVQANNIQLALLLTEELDEQAHAKLTLGDIRSICNVIFDVVELQAFSNDERKTPDTRDYTEVIVAIQNNLWSNADHPKSSA